MKIKIIVGLILIGLDIQAAAPSKYVWIDNQTNYELIVKYKPGTQDLRVHASGQGQIPVDISALKSIDSIEAVAGWAEAGAKYLGSVMRSAVGTTPKPVEFVDLLNILGDIKRDLTSDWKLAVTVSGTVLHAELSKMKEEGAEVEEEFFLMPEEQKKQFVPEIYTPIIKREFASKEDIQQLNLQILSQGEQLLGLAKNKLDMIKKYKQQLERVFSPHNIVQSLGNYLAEVQKWKSYSGNDTQILKEKQQILSEFPQHLKNTWNALMGYWNNILAIEHLLGDAQLGNALKAKDVSQRTPRDFMLYVRKLLTNYLHPDKIFTGDFESVAEIARVDDQKLKYLDKAAAQKVTQIKIVKDQIVQLLTEISKIINPLFDLTKNVFEEKQEFKI